VSRNPKIQILDFLDLAEILVFKPELLDGACRNLISIPINILGLQLIKRRKTMLYDDKRLAFNAFYDAVRDESQLDRRTTVLIGLAAAMTSGCGS
jgi:hypothetical protein